MGLKKSLWIDLRELVLVFDQLGGQLKNQLTQIGSGICQSAVSVP